MATTEEKREEEPESGNSSTKRQTRSRSEGRPRRKLTAAKAAVAAGTQLADLVGKDVESISGVSRTDEGWQVRVDVVEVRRIPETTDILAVFDVELDEDGELVEYRRSDRYVRGRADDGGR
jgi:hypothetical protein